MVINEDFKEFIELLNEHENLEKVKEKQEGKKNGQ